MEQPNRHRQAVYAVDEALEVMDSLSQLMEQLLMHQSQAENHDTRILNRITHIWVGLIRLYQDIVSVLEMDDIMIAMEIALTLEDHATADLFKDKHNEWVERNGQVYEDYHRWPKSSRYLEISSSNSL